MDNIGFNVKQNSVCVFFYSLAFNVSNDSIESTIQAIVRQLARLCNDDGEESHSRTQHTLTHTHDKEQRND